MSIKIIQGLGTDSIKWDGMLDRFGRDDLLPVWTADMDFEAAPCITEALQSKASQSVTAGFVPDKLFDNFIKWEKNNHNWEIKSEWMCVVPDITSALSWTLLMMTKPSDGVLVLSPANEELCTCVTNNDRRLVRYEMPFDGNECRINFEHIEEDMVRHRIKFFIFASPADPVGRVWRADEIMHLMEICQKHDVYVFSDEEYQDFVFAPHKHVPTAALSDYFSLIVTAVSPSRTFNIAGAGCGIVIIPDDELRARFKDFQTRIGAKSVNVLSCEACSEAYAGAREWVDEVKTSVWQNYVFIREYLENNAPEVRISSLQGSYMLWLDFGFYLRSADAVKTFFEEKCGVAVDYGVRFGEKYETCVRFNLASDIEVIEKMMDSIFENLKGTIEWNLKL